MHTSSAVVRSESVQQPKTLLRRAPEGRFYRYRTQSRIQTLEYSSIHRVMGYQFT